MLCCFVMNIEKIISPNAKGDVIDWFRQEGLLSDNVVKKFRPNLGDEKLHEALSEIDTQYLVAILDEPLDPQLVATTTLLNLLGQPVFGIRTDVRGPYGGSMHFFPRLQLDFFTQIQFDNSVMSDIDGLQDILSKGSHKKCAEQKRFLTANDLNANGQDKIEMKDKVYIAGSLFEIASLFRNLQLSDIVQPQLDTIVPQRDGFEFSKIAETLRGEGIKEEQISSYIEMIIYYLDIGKFILNDSAVVIVDLSGEHIDEGAVVEMIIAKAAGKRVIGIGQCNDAIPGIISSHCDTLLSFDSLSNRRRELKCAVLREHAKYKKTDSLNRINQNQYLRHMFNTSFKLFYGLDPINRHVKDIVNRIGNFHIGNSIL